MTSFTSNKKTATILFCLCVLCIAAAPFTAYFLRLQTSADGGGYSFTNLNGLIATGSVYLGTITGPATNQLSTGIAGQTPWQTNIDAAGFNLSNVAFLFPTNLSLRGNANAGGKNITNVSRIIGQDFNGGGTFIQSGTNSSGGAGGDLNLSGGASGFSAGGNVNISAGNTFGLGNNGGNITIAAGTNTTGYGGAVTISSGTAGGSGSAGNVLIYAGDVNQAAGGTPGHITLRPGITDGGKIGYTEFGYDSGIGTVTSNRFIGPTYFKYPTLFTMNSGAEAIIISNGVIRMNNAASAIAIRTNDPGTNSLDVHGNANFESISINGVGLQPNSSSGTNNVLQSVYDHGTIRINSGGITGFIFFPPIANCEMFRCYATNSSQTLLLNIDNGVATSGQIETHSWYLSNVGTNNIALSIGNPSYGNWVWISEDQHPVIPTNIAPSQIYIFTGRHFGGTGQTNWLVSYQTATNTAVPGF